MNRHNIFNRKYHGKWSVAWSASLVSHNIEAYGEVRIDITSHPHPQESKLLVSWVYNLRKWGDRWGCGTLYWNRG
ncbi:hypothetical protein H5410_036746 [Solanum commersonii]|uniref:Uncharacterized protein n=1 Tax=Solanum commersonii TaxID=4109 RepID=A0A9J5Y651_SOLCO|nr:hypothetical protein H5410_036746 [Solanum commersonii]